MRRLGPVVMAALGAAIISTAAIGSEPVSGPAYVGDRSNNPEQETYAVAGSPDDPKTLAFVGPATSYGQVTGDPEKDTIAYRPILITPTGTQASLSPGD